MLILILVIIKHLSNYLEIFINKNLPIDYADRKQDEITGVMGALKRYAPRDNKYVDAKNKLVNNVENFYKGRVKIFERFKNGVFPVYYCNFEFSEDEDDDDDEKDIEEQEEQKPITYNYKTLIKQSTDEEKDINNEVFKKYFKVQMPSDMLMFLNRTNDTEMKNQLVNLINSGLKDLKKN